VLFCTEKRREKRENSSFFEEIILDFSGCCPYNSFDKERSVDPMTVKTLVSGVCASIFMPVSRIAVSAALLQTI